LILIDGYNLLFVGSKGKPNVDIKKAREKLIGLLSKYNSKKGSEITVVFDRADSVFTHGLKQRHKQAGMEIIFTPPDMTADDYIINSVQESKDKKGIKVVTSDRKIVDAVTEYGSEVVSSSQFMEELATITGNDNIYYDPKEHGISSEDTKQWMKEFGLDDNT